ncbi:MAG: sulfonate ABC transporter substrate-binding protein [Oscillatoriales cyanobacterium C42_A2020_001]|nr:sulfonate ABC transporter substrate-binding protein [Leptolyngbyaceae cyanobacterium C42_A2020_001]
MPLLKFRQASAPWQNISTRAFPLLFVVSLAFSLLLPLVDLGLPNAAVSSAPAIAQSKELRIGHQKFDPLTLVKNRGNLAARLKPLGINSVKWVEFASGPPMLEALNAGSIDIARTGDVPPVIAQAAGVPIVYVGGSAPKDQSSAVLVKRDSPIKTIRDLKGKKVGFTKSSSANYLIVKVLESAGLKWEDITPAYLTPADARAAFEQGSIDAWAIWDPFYAAAQIQSDARVIRNSSGLVSNRDFYLSSRSFADQNPAVIRALRAETQKVAAWASKNPSQVAEQLSKDLKIDKSILETATKRRNWGFEPITPKMIGEQQNIADVFQRIKLIPKSIKVADAVHPSAIASASKNR